MDHRKLRNLFQGIWSFTREVRSLNSQKLMTSAQDGCASFIAWFHPDQLTAETPEPTAGENTTWLLYREKGTMLTDDPSLPKGSFTRQYLYDFAKKESVKVHFCEASVRSADNLDPRNLDLQNESLSSFQLLHHFHELVIEANSEELSLDRIKCLKSSICLHPCEQDVYEGVFTLLDENNYTSTWKVTGPQKSYQISTKYSKESVTSQ